MRVLFQTYSLAHQSPGGGERVIAHLFKELLNLGVDVKLREPWRDHPEDFDILHFFSLSESAHLPFFRKNCPKLKIVVTPTFYVESKNGVLARWKEKLGSEMGIFENKRMVNVAAVDRFFPNTDHEKNQLQNYLGVDSRKIKVIGNGISPIFGSKDGEEFRKFSGIRGDFVLHVGRFDPVKRQDFLIEALGELDLQLVFIGDPNAFSGEYYEKCKKLANLAPKAKISFFSNVKPDSSLLASAMAAAKVFVLPSTFETFGLAAVEAQASGCDLILSNGVVAKEFFPDAEFLPLKKDLWKNSVWAQLGRSGQKKSVSSERFHWRSLARTLVEEYKKV